MIFIHERKYKNAHIENMEEKTETIPLIIRLVISILWPSRSDTHIWFKLSRLEQRRHNNTHVW
jgi:hypothetical protein